jgi:TorA maturation chaperone TorD
MMQTERTHRICEVDAIDLALCRATLYSACAIGFRPPSEGALERLAGNDNITALTEAAALMDPAPQSQIVACLTALFQAGQVEAAYLSERHRALFGHTARGQVSPYETEYGHEAIFQQPQDLSDLMGFYQAFHLAMKDDSHERPDHISCECEFVSFLALKESYALQHEAGQMLSETCKAQKLFLRDHLGRFVPSFVHGIRQHEHIGFYRNMSELLLAVVGFDCRRFDVPLGGTKLGLRAADDDSIPMACGSGGECAAMPGSCPHDEDGSYGMSLDLSRKPSF